MAKNADVYRLTNKQVDSVHVFFMPWAGLKNEMHFGPVRMWTWSDSSKRKVTDVTRRNQLEKLFACYRDSRDQSVRSVTVCSDENADFRETTPDVRDAILKAVDSLIVSIICDRTATAVANDNNSMAPPSSEKYTLLHQRFPIGANEITVCDGYNNVGGLPIDTIKFFQPHSIGGIFCQPCNSLFSRLADLWSQSDNPLMRNRVFRSLEWFRYAHVASDLVSPFARVVMTATAFESLLDIPRVNDKKKEILDRLNELDFKHLLKSENRNHNKKPVNASKLAWWLYDFYDLRNKIVHGNEISPTELVGDKWQHVIIADIVFGHCLDWQLNMNLPSDAQLSSATGDDERAERIKRQVLFCQRWGLAYKKLGWLE